MSRKNINTTIDNELYSDIKKLAYKISAQKEVKINANDLIEEGMKLVLDKYRNIK